MLNNIKYKLFYHLPKDKDEYIKLMSEQCLKNSILYKRASAYWTCESIQIFKDNIKDFILRNGKIQYIISSKISEDDYIQIFNGYYNRINSIIYNQWRRDIQHLTNDDLCRLCFLIQIGVVDVKICLTTNNRGIFHSKFGLFIDKNNNIVAFAGSNNETYNGTHNNVETVTVYSSENELNRTNNLLDTFNSWWNNTNIKDCYTVDIPECVYNEIDNNAKMGQLFFNKDIFCASYENKRLIISANPDILNNYHIFQKIFNKNSHKYEFSSDYHIKDIEWILKELKKIAKKNGVVLIQTKKLLSYIRNNAKFMEEKRKIGLLCKSKRFNYFGNEFFDFRNEIKNLIYRELRPKQIEDMFYSMKMQRCANFSVPGSGKTTIMLGTYAYLKKCKIVDKLIIIGPNNCEYSWFNEFEYCFNRYPNVLTKKQSTIYNVFETLKENVDYYFINFDSTHTKFANNLKNIIDDKTMVVIDEYHKIKKINGQWSTNVISICDNADYIYCLTGTPIPNGLIDIYNLIYILYKRNIYYFNKFKNKDSYLNLSNNDIKEFNDLFYPFFIRTSKKQLDIPLAEPNKIIDCDASDDENILIQYIIKHVNDPLEKFIRINQASSCPLLLTQKINFSEYDNENNKFVESDFYKYLPNHIQVIINNINNKGSTKIFHALEKIKILISNNKKVIVWCTLNATIHILASKLKSLNYKFKIVNGVDTPTQTEKQNAISDFINTNVNILITNPNTLAESVSLHTVCHDSIYIDYSYNLVHYLQSKDRIHRLGLSPQQKTNYYFLNLNIINTNNIMCSFDKQVLMKLYEKEELMNEIIENDKFQTSNKLDLSIDEIKEIFNKIT